MSDKSLKEVFQKISGEQTSVTVTKAVITSTNPLAAHLLNDDKIILNSRLLIIPKHLTDYSVTINIDSEERQAVVHNSLKSGDIIYVLSYNFGKKYIALGRV